MKKFSDLSVRELLALAISLEEEDGRIYSDFAAAMAPSFPDAAHLFSEMADEESEHRRILFEAYRAQFGDHVPLIRRQDVKGFVSRSSLHFTQELQPQKLRREAASMELETRRFYERAVEFCEDTSVRQLLGDLARVEAQHEERFASMEETQRSAGAIESEQVAAQRLFVLQVIQPGLAGLMDGSVSTLAPLFAAAFATNNSFDAFRVGLAASVGAGISMGFAEALSDDGEISGRGTPILRGGICGLMTTVGGIGHTLPYLIPNFHVATGVAFGIVAVELAVIAWIRHRYMHSPLASAALQIGLGGILVFLTGILIGVS